MAGHIANLQALTTMGIEIVQVLEMRYMVTLVCNTEDVQLEKVYTGKVAIICYRLEHGTDRREEVGHPYCQNACY